jgi:hypothetical protein
MCPCPRCLTPKGLFSCLGLVKDMKSCITNLRVYAMTKVIEAREYIYGRGNTVDSAKVDDALGEGSWVPILVSATGSVVVHHALILALAESIRRKAWTVWS